MNKPFEYNIDPDFDYTIDEKGNTFIALRKISWNGGQPKLDIRKYYASEEGERMNKGVSFLTDDGPDELTKVLIETGYGDDSELADSIIRSRPYIVNKIKNALDNDPSLVEKISNIEYEEDNFYDPEELLV